MINISVSKLIDRSGEQAIGQGVGGVRHEEGQKHMLGAQEIGPAQKMDALAKSHVVAASAAAVEDDSIS